MSMPYYMSPEQVMKDRADYARKGIARGRALVGLECADGVALVAENPSASLNKIAEIYDRIAFAGVGRYNEFEQLKISGIRHADVTGYQYSRDDVDARALANAYAQLLGQIFTHEMKPYEVEILVASVGAEPGDPNRLFHILYDGTVMDEHGYSVLGGNAEAIAEALEGVYQDGLSLAEAVRLGASALGKPDDRTLEATQLEVAVLDRAHGRRTFRRLTTDEVAALLAGVATESPSLGPSGPQSGPAQ
jgi:proteasome alpha subunit